MSNFVKIIAFDLETTGLDVSREEIIEIGAILFSVKESRGRMVPEKLDEFQSFIKASKPIPAEATKINHITDEMLSTAPSRADVLQKFKIFCDNANCMVAHNAAFDTGFLSAAYGKHIIPAPLIPILDSIKIARNIVQLPDYKLGTIARVFEAKNEISLKVKDDSMHRAVYDCEMLMHILIALLRDRLSVEEWAGQEFLQALKRKDIHQDVSQIKPVKPKAASLF
ncbi:MAG: 3'-5' exonuclease [Fibromonadaceae bacterium]|jgi:DNA polymerase III epsilon subunit family exonuclease|nr:3'-5' exonuclease [Fibromonadaceae bacterium]